MSHLGVIILLRHATMVRGRTYQNVNRVRIFSIFSFNHWKSPKRFLNKLIQRFVRGKYQFKFYNIWYSSTLQTFTTCSKKRNSFGTKNGSWCQSKIRMQRWLRDGGRPVHRMPVRKLVRKNSKMRRRLENDIGHHKKKKQIINLCVCFF